MCKEMCMLCVGAKVQVGVCTIIVVVGCGFSAYNSIS